MKKAPCLNANQSSRQGTKPTTMGAGEPIITGLPIKCKQGVKHRMTAKRAAQNAKVEEALHHAFLVEALLAACERAEGELEIESFLILIQEHFHPILESLGGSFGDDLTQGSGTPHSPLHHKNREPQGIPFRGEKGHTYMMGLLEITNSVMNVRSLLDLVTEYLLRDQAGRTEAERLETVSYAVEVARDTAREAEEALYSYQPPRDPKEKALELENEVLKAHIIRLEEEKAGEWRSAREEAKAFQLKLMTEAHEEAAKGE